MNNFNPMQIIQMFQQSNNPQATFEMLLNKNPQLAASLQQVMNSTQGANPRDIAMQLAQQRGIPQEQVMQMFNNLTRR